MNRQTPSEDSSSAGGGPIVHIEGLTKEYRNRSGSIQVLRGIGLSVYPGEMAAIMGPSGSGKSTLLFILGLLLFPTAGTYLVMGRDIWKADDNVQAEFRRRTIGFVFQSCNLVENTTVYENLELPLIYAGVKRRERPARVREALERVGLLERMHHPANLLSGGEQQRAAVARALVNHPRIVLADEPTGQLDRRNGLLVLDHFQEIASRGETAVVIVTHDPEVAARCNRKFMLEDGILRSG